MEVLLRMNDACQKKHGGSVKRCLRTKKTYDYERKEERKEESRSEEKSRRDRIEIRCKARVKERKRLKAKNKMT